MKAISEGIITREKNALEKILADSYKLFYAYFIICRKTFICLDFI